MAYDLRSRHGADETTHAGRAQGSSMVPGKRSAAAELHSASPVQLDQGNDRSPGPSGAGRGGSSPPLFAGAVAWEDIHDEDFDGEDPLAQEEALKPDEDEEEAAVQADEEGELDTESEVDEQEDAGQPLAPEAQASEPDGSAVAPAPAGNVQAATAGQRGGHREGHQPVTAQAARAGKTYHVHRAYRDGPYRGTAEYDVRVTGKDITITVGIRLSPKRGVTRKQVKRVKSESQEMFRQKYDGRFKLTEIPYKPRPLKMRVRFAHPNPHHNVALHKGEGRNNAANWYVKSEPTTRAHEIGHLLGLKDEYEDPNSPKRKVYTDNSLMGNYYNEGIRTASLKKRHGKVFARDISRASGRKFHVSS